MDDFVPLPAPSANIPWSPNVLNAAQRLSAIFTKAVVVLGQEAEAGRLAIHKELIEHEARPLLEALEVEAATEGIPKAWVHLNAERFARLAVQLARAHTTAKNHEDRNVFIPKPVQLVRNKKRGPPSKVIDSGFLWEAMKSGRRITIAKLTRALPVHRNTIRKYIKSHHDLRLQRHRVLASIARVDGLGIILRRNRAIRRRKYRVLRPNALWHIDGHHKLILWGIVIHGIVDGYGRDVMGLHASTNNRAGTVLQVFHGAVEHYGTPSRTRGDYGTENKLVALYMILTRGANRGSFIWGSRLSDNEEQDMRFLGMTTEGVYVDDCAGMSSSEIHDHYGADVDHQERPSNQTGAGSLSDEDFSDVSESELDSGDEDSDLEGIDLPPSARQVFDGLDGLMQRVHVKRYPCPFNQDELGLFIQALATAEEEDLEPRGFGVLPEEWENGRYPAYELLKTGKKGTKELRVDLPDHVWRPRAMKWARALVLMEYMLESSSH
ncbi:hypothetical protein PM082_023813 [Marasmius tenuissimus]|nr:hypothetical protein PM082_023813 [Marasmius tenuissimus]